MENSPRRLRLAKRILAVSFRAWANYLTPVAKRYMESLVPNYYTLSAQEAYDTVKNMYLQGRDTFPDHQAEHMLLAIATAHGAAKEAAALKQQPKQF